MIHGVTDNDADLNALFAEAAKRGARDVSASYLFLRPAIIGSLRRSIHDEELLRRILAPFGSGGRSSFNTRSADTGGTSLPVDLRQTELNRIRQLAERHGLVLRICGCKNGDITNSKCHLTNLTTTARANKQAVQQPSLW